MATRIIGNMKYTILNYFALEELHFYALAEKTAKEALSIYPENPVATHSMSHVLDATCRPREGVDFLTITRDDWVKTGFALHIDWHRGLYHIEEGEFKEALDIYDECIARRNKEFESKKVMGLRDAVTLLYRLKLEGVDPGAERWREVAALCEKHMNNHTLALTDSNLMLGLCASGEKQLAADFIESTKEIIKSSKDTTLKKVGKEVLLALYEGIVAFESGDYAKAVESILPVKYKIINIGGSDAQKDIFHQLLLNAAVRAPGYEKLASQLLAERRAFKDTPVVDRISRRMLQLHERTG